MIRTASTVSELLAQLSPEERAEIRKVRAVIRKSLPRGYQEGVNYGMICYSIPLSRFSDTYNGQALCYAALAPQKNHHSLYLMGVYGDPAARRDFERAFKASGRKLDMGKSCVRFKSADDLPLDVIGDAIARTSVDDYIALYRKAKPARKKSAKKAAKKK